MGLTPNMIKIIKDEIIPDLKREYGVKNKDEFRGQTDIDMVELTGLVCLEDFPDEYLKKYDWLKQDIEELGQEQVILNMVWEWLIDEDW